MVRVSMVVLYEADLTTLTWRLLFNTMTASLSFSWQLISQESSGCQDHKRNTRHWWWYARAAGSAGVRGAIPNGQSALFSGI